MGGNPLWRRTGDVATGEYPHHQRLHYGHFDVLPQKEAAPVARIGPRFARTA
jgi:hypothetical protein